MAAPTYVAKKVGDQYIVVPKNAPATKAGSCCLVTGGALVLAGAVMRGLKGVALTAVGVNLLYRGATGQSLCAKFARRHRVGGPSGDPRQSPTFQNDVRPTTQAPADDVDEAAMESFPASDPPARTATSSL
jgi:hypothetical protein